MPSQSANQTALRADGHKLRAWVSFYIPVVAASGSITALPPAHLSGEAATNLSVSFSTGSSADVKRGFLVRIKTSGGTLRGLTRVRYSGTIDSTHLPIRELSRGEMVVANGDTFEVLREVRISDKLVTATEDFNPDGIAVSSFNSNPPPIANSGGLWVGWVDDGETFATVNFYGSLSANVDPDSTAGHDGTHLWGIPTGAGDFATGSAEDDADPTMELNAGSWLIEHTYTDADNSVSTTQYIPVIVHDSTHLPHECLIEPLSGEHDNGWSYSVQVFEDATETDIPYGSLAIIWLQETIGGVAQSFGSPVTGRSHIKGVGYIRRHTEENTPEEDDSLVFDVISPLARLAETPGFSKVMIREASPDAWAEIRTLKTVRAMLQLAQFYTNFNEAGFDFIVDSDCPDHDYPLLFLSKDNPLGQIRELARATRNRFICDRRGRFELQPVLNLMNRTTRDGRSTQYPFELDDITFVRVSEEHWRPIETFRVKGFTAHATDPHPVFARWPGAAPGQGSQNGEQTGIISANTASVYAECGLWGALADGIYTDETLVNHFAPRVTIRTPGSYDFLDFYGEWIGLNFSTRIRVTDLSQFRFELVRASITYESGTAECEFELQAETFGEPGVDDPQDQVDTGAWEDPGVIWLPIEQIPVYPNGLPEYTGDIIPTKGIVFDAGGAHCSIFTAFNPAASSLVYTDVSTGLGSGFNIWACGDAFNWNRYYALQSDGLYVNSDPFGGASWSLVHSNASLFGDAARIGRQIFTSINRQGYFGIRSGNMYVYTTDNWATVSRVNITGGADAYQTALDNFGGTVAISHFNNPGGEGWLYASMYNGSGISAIYKSVDWGASWSSLTTVNFRGASASLHLPYRRPGGSLDNVNDASQVIYGQSGGFGLNGRLTRSDDGGATWDDMYAGTGNFYPWPSQRGPNMQTFTYDSDIVLHAISQSLGSSRIRIAEDEGATTIAETMQRSGSGNSNLYVNGYPVHSQAAISWVGQGDTHNIMWTLDNGASLGSADTPANFSGSRFASYVEWNIADLV